MLHDFQGWQQSLPKPLGLTATFILQVAQEVFSQAQNAFDRARHKILSICPSALLPDDILHWWNGRVAEELLFRLWMPTTVQECYDLYLCSRLFDNRLGLSNYAFQEDLFYAYWNETSLHEPFGEIGEKVFHSQWFSPMPFPNAIFEVHQSGYWPMLFTSEVVQHLGFLFHDSPLTEEQVAFLQRIVYLRRSTVFGDEQVLPSRSSPRSRVVNRCVTLLQAAIRQIADQNRLHLPEMRGTEIPELNTRRSANATDPMARTFNVFLDEINRNWFSHKDIRPFFAQDTSSPTVPTPLPETPPDPFADLRAFARRKLKGQELTTVEALCNAGGELPLADLALVEGIEWQDPILGFANVSRRLKPKLNKVGFLVFRQNNTARLTRNTVRK